MLDITVGSDDQIILTGRFDASQVEKARQFFFALPAGCVVDLGGLDYISSAGLGILLATQKRLAEIGDGLRLVNPPAHIRDVFHFSGFDQVFRID